MKKCLLVLSILLLFSSKADSSVMYYDDFESYPTAESMNPPSSGIYSMHWNSDAPRLWDPDNGAWTVGTDPVYAPEFGKFVVTYGLPSQTTEHWLSFTANSAIAITEAVLEFDYLVQENTELDMYISTISDIMGLVPVPYSFIKRSNDGEIVDSTGQIDLMPYMTPDATRLVVRFDTTTTGSSSSHIRIDNFNLIVPEPVTLLLLGLGGLFLRKRKV